MKTVHAIWELENIGVDAWELSLEASDTPESVAAEEKRITALGARYIVVKTPVNCPALIFGLPELGYANVETVFHVEISRKSYHMPDNIARFDRGLDVVRRESETELEEVCAKIRKGVFVSDRVSIDPMFTLEQSGNRYANWLCSMVKNGAFLYEMIYRERPIGFFVIMRKDERTVDPVLMGLYDEQRDRGMGALLHKKTLDTCFTHECDRLTSTIVSNNSKVLRVYINAGADISDTLYTYVKHIER